MKFEVGDLIKSELWYGFVIKIKGEHMLCYFIPDQRQLAGTWHPPPGSNWFSMQTYKRSYKKVS